MDGGAWWAAVHGVAKRRTRLSDFTLTFHFHAFEKEMATHSSVLAWRILGMELASRTLKADSSPSRHLGSSSKKTFTNHLVISHFLSSKGLLLLLLSRFSCVRLCATPETAAHQAPPSLGFSRQERWSRLPFPSRMHESEKSK